MTPTEQDKELQQWLIEHTGLIEETGGAVWRELEVETFMYHLRELITADRKRVALEARIDELKKIEIGGDNIWTVNSGTDTAMLIEERIAELKAQQEEV